MEFTAHNTSNTDLFNIDEPNINASFENEDKVIEALTNFYNNYSNSKPIEPLDIDNTIAKAYESLDDIFKILDNNFINI